MSKLELYSSSGCFNTIDSLGDASTHFCSSSRSSNAGFNLPSALPDFEYPAPFLLDAATKLRHADFEDSTTASSEPDVDIADVAPITVKNTFIHLDCCSPNEFAKDRQIQSCPVSAIGQQDRLEPAAAAAHNGPGVGWKSDTYSTDADHQTTARPAAPLTLEQLEECLRRRHGICSTQVDTKNTFVNVRTCFLDEYLEHRQVQSCPTSILEQLEAEPAAVEEEYTSMGAEATPSDFDGQDVWPMPPSAVQGPRFMLPSSMAEGSTPRSCSASCSSAGFTAKTQDRLQSLRMRGTVIQHSVDFQLNHDATPPSWQSSPPREHGTGDQGEALACLSAPAFLPIQPEPHLSAHPAVSRASAVLHDGTIPVRQLMPLPPPMAAPHLPAVLRLSETVMLPEPGTAELPNIGSLLHYSGGCKPCSFFHSNRCVSKDDCKFCHLCGPNEKKRRVKLQRQAQREQRNAAQMASMMGILSGSACIGNDTA